MTQPGRVNYFERQYLRLPEFRDEQAYHIALRRRHNLSHHDWGIVVGLEIVKESGRPVVRPGLAIDGYGRELLLLERKPVGREIFDQYATTRLDLWLEYQLDYGDDITAPVECGGRDPRRRYRVTERARVVFERAGAARVAADRPPPVPAEELEAFPPRLPDDPAERWPVYLGRIILEIPESGEPDYVIDLRDRVYVGLHAEIIDHPGNVTRLELGRASDTADTRTLDDKVYTYAPHGSQQRRDFAVFVPPVDPKQTTLQPTISVQTDGTQILGTTTVRGDVVLEGTALVFPGAMPITTASPPPNEPAIYRAQEPGVDELRIDVGDPQSAARTMSIGLNKDGKWQPGLTIDFTQTPAVVTVNGDLHIEGTFDADDIRLRTLKEEVIPQLAAMFQLAIMQS